MCRHPAARSPQAQEVERFRCPDRHSRGRTTGWVVSGVMTPADSDPHQESETQSDEPVPAAGPPSRLREAAAGMTEAQAWKGQQMAKGWRKLVNALHRRNEGENSGSSSRSGDL